MIKCAAAGLSVSIAVFLGVLWAGNSPASADPDPGSNPGQQQFVHDLAGVGIVATNGDQGLINQGELLCGDMAGGNTREKETNIANGRIPGSNVDQAKAVVDFAVNDLCPGAPPLSAVNDQATAEKAVEDGYIEYQKRCTPDLTPRPQSITWDQPGFSQQTGGSGMIHDANPSLGGQFLAMWVVGRRDVQYQFC